MRIALLGGTGDIGEGLALRWGYGTDHEILIGSRDLDRDRTKAAAYETELSSRGVDRTIEGLRALDAGGIANAPEVEALTPLLVNVAANNRGLHGPGVRFQ